MMEDIDTLRSSHGISISRMEILNGTDVFFSIEGDSVPPKRHSHRELHHHTHYELVFVEEGELLQHFENGSFRYQQGDVCLLDRNTRHLEGFESDCHLVFVNLPPDFLKTLLDPAGLHSVPDQYTPGALYHFIRESKLSQSSEYLDLTADTAARATVHLRVTSLLKTMEETLRLKLPGYGYRTMGLLLELFSLLEDPSLYHLTRIRVDSRPEDFVFQRAVSIMMERHGRISREELASMVHYNPDYLNRIIKQHCGLSISNLGQQIALERAKELMREDGCSISEIIQKLGYTNRSHFYRMFEASEGMSPGAWKKSHTSAGEP